MDGTAARILTRAAALATRTTVACAVAAYVPAALAAEPARSYDGTLVVAESAGHDCLPLAMRELTIELVVGAPLADAALVGFGDGHVLRWRHTDGALQVEDAMPVVPIERLLVAEGAQVALTAPGTETCRWSGTLRMQPSTRPDGEARVRQLMDLDRANALFAEGDALLAKGKADEANPVYVRAVAVRAAALGAEHPLTLRAELRIARALQLDGKAEAARVRTEQLLATQERAHGAEAFDTLRVRAALGLMLWAEGRPQDGLPVMQRAYDSLRTRYGAEHLETLFAQNNLALILWDLGRLSEAAAHLEFQLPRMVAVRGESSQRSLDAMNNLGLIYQGLGRHAAALELLERAYRLSIPSLGAEHPDTLTTLLSVGVGYAQLDRVEDAMAIYRVAFAGLRKALGDDHQWTLTAQSNIAASLLDLQRGDEARSITVDLVERAERSMGPTHLYTLRWSTMLGGALFQTGDFAGAAREYARVNAEQQKAFGADHPDTLESLFNLGQSRYLSGERTQGLAELERAVAELRRVNGPFHRVTLTALVGLAEALRAEGRRDEAVRLFGELVDAVERLRIDEGLARETRQAFFARWSSGYKQLAFLHGLREPSAAFRVAELSKARTLLESLALRSADMAGVVGSEDASRLTSLEARISELANAMAQAAGRGDEAFKIESERNALTREAAAFRRDLRARFPRYAELAEVELIDAAGVSSLARPGEALISYLIVGDDAMAFVGRRGRPLAVIMLGSVKGLDRSVEAYRTLLVGLPADDPRPVWRRRDGSFVASLSRPDDAVSRVRDANVIGRALAARLIAPLEPALRGARRWIISPDGALAALPFEALPRHGKPLIAGATVSYVQSLSVLALMKARPSLAGAERSLLAMGAPRFGDPVDLAANADASAGQRIATRLVRGASDEGVSRSYEDRGLRWSALPGAEREIEAVAALFPAAGRVVAMHDAASEARLRALNASGELARFRYLLFATHAYLDTVVPARSALVLSQVDLPPGTDGYVTVAKWAAYRLQSELTVLSACETGLGRQVQGEGVMGLPYALFVAGNRSTVLTLWRIEDAATAAFVTALFRRIRDGADAAAALAATKRSFLAGPLRHRAAAVWAPFVLYGR